MTIRVFIKENLKMILLGLFLVMFILIILVSYANQFPIMFSNEQSDWAGFGSYIGGTLGTLFAFTSFGILFYTFNLQKKQAKNNLEIQKKQAKNNLEIQKKQEKNNKIQRFENTFFALLELHNKSLNIFDRREKVVNVDDFYGYQYQSSDNIIAQRLREIKSIEYTEGSEHPKAEVVKVFDERLKIVQENINHDIGLSQYFRILYQILKFIAENNIYNLKNEFNKNYLLGLDENKIKHEKTYASLVRAFVPVELLPVLALNCIPTPESHHNLDLYNSLLERYNFLEHMQLKPLTDPITSILIMSNYSRALGENTGIDDKVKKVVSKYPQLLEIQELNKGYLLKHIES